MGTNAAFNPFPVNSASAGQTEKDSANPQVESEPSMEEILASIRRIISDDQKSVARVRSAAETASDNSSNSNTRVLSEPAPAGAVRSIDIDELAQLLEKAPDVMSAQGRANMIAGSLSDSPRITPSVESIPEPERAPVQVPRQNTQTQTDSSMHDDMMSVLSLSEEAIISTAQTGNFDKAFTMPTGGDPAITLRAALPAVAQPVNSTPHSSVAETVATAGQNKAIGDAAERLMRPMLKQWIDDNLATLVEKIVREEIERAARGL